MSLELSEIRAGLVRRRELERLGLSSSAIRAAQQRGELIRLTWGIYLEGEVAQKCQPRDKALALTMALGLARQSAVISHQSAALIWGAPLLSLPTRVHLSLASSDKSKHRQATFHNHRTQIFEESVLREGVRVTNPYTTLLDCLRTSDLQEPLAMADYFLARGLLEQKELVERLSRVSGRGARRAKVLAQLASPLSESPLESLARLRLYQAGLDLGVQQLRLRTPSGRYYRPDFCWPQLKLILEVDGLHKYFGAYRPTEEQIRKDFLRQRELEQAGWTLVRATWEELEKRPALITDRLRALGVGRAQ